VPVLDGRPTIFALDLMGSYKTPAVLDKLPSLNLTPSLIPSGCTSLIQPLDVSINKPFKEILRELTDTTIFESKSVEAFDKWTIDDCRILTTSCVGDTFYKFHLQKGNLIQKVFWKRGLSLPSNGTCDHEFDIKGFSELEIGDWHVDYGAVDEAADISIDNDDDHSIEFV